MSTFAFENQPIQAEPEDTVLETLLRNEVEIPNRCRAGACQACMLRSDHPVPKSSQLGIDEDLAERGVFLSCQAKADEVTSAERLGSEVFPRYAATLVQKSLVADDVLILRLDVPGWQASPGRFIHLHHPDGVDRPYSLAAPAWLDASTVIIHVRIISGGEMSQRLLTTPVGEQLEIEGPFGKCRYRSATQLEPILLIGSGTGLAPLYGIITDSLQQGHQGPISLHFGAATSSRLYHRAELDELKQKYPNFNYSTYADAEVEPGDSEGSPLSGALQQHPNLDGYKVYLCGHPGLVKAAQKKCFLMGASLKDIAADAFVAA